MYRPRICRCFSPNLAVLSVFLLAGVLFCTWHTSSTPGVAEEQILETWAKHTRDITEFMMDAVQCGGDHRREILQRHCARYRNTAQVDGNTYDFSHPRSYRRFLMDDHDQVAYCVVPKASCTSWKLLMGQTSGKLTEADYKRKLVEYVHGPAYLNTTGLRWAEHLPMAQIQWRLNSYFKFIIVRHPFTRLLSAWQDKFVNEFDLYGKQYYRQISTTFPEAILSEDPLKVDLPFSGFVHLVVNRIGRIEGDIHWLPQTDLCHPCHVNYDFIAKMETLAQDTQILLPRFNATSLPRMNEAGSATKTPRPNLLQAMKGVPAEDFRKLFELYKTDMELFGYGWDWSLGATCSTREQGRVCC